MIAVEEYLSWVDEEEKTLHLPVAGNLTTAWLGANGGHVAPVSPIRLRAAQKTVGVLKINYQATYQAFVLRNVPAAIPRVLVFLRGRYG